MNISLHLASPLKETHQFSPFAPHEFPKLQKADLGHFHPRVGFDAPQKIRAAPGSKAMTSSGIPDEPETVVHHQHHKRSLQGREAVDLATARGAPQSSIEPMLKS